jgi:hypothetical protein
VDQLTRPYPRGAIAAGTITEDRGAYSGVIRPRFDSKHASWRCEHHHEDVLAAWQCARRELALVRKDPTIPKPVGDRDATP